MRAKEFAPPAELVDYLDACGVDVLRRWDKVPDGIVFCGCSCVGDGPHDGEPVTVLRQCLERWWRGLQLGDFKIGICPRCSVIKWNRVVAPPTPRRTSRRPYVPPRLVGLLGDQHGRIRRLE